MATVLADRALGRALAGFREVGQVRDAADLALLQRAFVPDAPNTGKAELDGLLAAAGTPAART